MADRVTLGSLTTFALDPRWVPSLGEDPSPPVDLGVAEQRYTRVSLLGQGGMGRVTRVWDALLERHVAMKELGPWLASHPRAIARFLDEARTVARLAHPAIIPVHDLGVLDDGRPFFTMKEVHGHTLGELAALLVAEGADMNRLVAAFARACEGVAFAHEAGVLHRDLKPENVLVGAHGEVVVLDWGLVRVVEDVVALHGTDITHSDTDTTLAGTPAYIAPELIAGASPDALTDVYGLGATLYHLLDGAPPYRSTSSIQTLAEVQRGPPPPLDDKSLLFGPYARELAAICARAMARRREDRYGSVTDLVDAVTDWLDGASRRHAALAVLREAEEADLEAARARDEATRLATEAAAALEPVAPWAPEADKAAGWALEAAAAEARQRALVADMRAESLLRAALSHRPDLPEAHDALATRFRAQHRRAEDAHDEAEALRAALLLREHATALPADHPRRADHLAWLSGDGALTLVTDPPGATVALARMEPVGRRLVPVPVGNLGTTPLRAVPLAMGSYVCRIRAPGRHPVDLPVTLGRQQHASGVRPGDTEPTAIHLPAEGELGPDDCLVPAGWFRAGGGNDAQTFERLDLWCDAFVMQRFPVTMAAYLDFLNALVDEGREPEALRHAPRESAADEVSLGALLVGREANGHFVLRPDLHGDTWSPHWPAQMIDWHGAVAYGRHLAATTGLAWRLPDELEWEKAARGTDGRRFPWGDGLDPSYCCMYKSHQDRPRPADVDSYPLDASPYGVRGLAGNARDWCANIARAEPDVIHRIVVPRQAGDDEPGLRAVRGGSFGAGHTYLTTTLRGVWPPLTRTGGVGFRLVRSVP